MMPLQQTALPKDVLLEIPALAWVLWAGVIVDLGGTQKPQVYL